MYLLSELIEVDRRFQNSVNLQLDLDRIEKIESYIPTHSTIRILDHYQENVKEGKEKATILIGPYGKGKSHLLLMLLHQIRQRKRPFLPILVSGTYEDLNQAFLMGMLDALKRAGLETLAPDSYYTKAAEMIAVWKKDYKNAYRMFSEALEGYGYQAQTFSGQLQKLDKKALHIFQKLYPAITSGSRFSPIVEMETTKLYAEITQKLAQEYDYGGIFIVFDEFSKYLEGHRQDTFARDMKILQDICELANASEDPQIHVVFVAHKSIKEYGAKLPKEMVHAFTGVEGRLKEVLFVVSSQNNYELMERALKKTPQCLQEIETTSPYFEHGAASYQIPCFHSLFQEEDFIRILVKGCFPLMPLTAYLLLQISEKAAQNERSIFTYLANDEKGSLYRHIKEAGQEQRAWAVTADTVYDYFAQIFKEDVSQTQIHAEWLKADYALSKTNDGNERKVIKVMALLGMIHKPEEVPVEEKTIRLALNLTKEVCHEALVQLANKQVIRWKTKSRSYVFINNVGVDLEKEIKEAEAKYFYNMDIAKEIEGIAELKFILPKLHNQEYTITRFFEYVYLTAEQFLKLSDGRLLFEEHFADGKIAAILQGSPAEEAVICQKVKALDDPRLVVLLPRQTFAQQEEVRKLLAVQRLSEDKEFIENNPVLKRELQNYEEDIRYEINRRIYRDFNPAAGACRVFYRQDIFPGGFMGQMTFNGFLSMICTDFYAQTPKVNNELINRQNISFQNRRARKKIISLLLSEADCSNLETGTGADATMYRAVFLRTGILEKGGQMDAGCRRLLEEINCFIAQCDGQKVLFSDLYERLMGKDYGARRGIIPVYLTNQLMKLHDTPVIYLNDKEVPLEADTIENINDTPAAYFLYLEHSTAQKEKYLNDLQRLFAVEEQTALGRRKRLSSIVEEMHRWYRSLPQLTMNFGKNPGDMEENMFREITAFRKTFRQIELNPRDILFDRLPDIFRCEDSKGLFAKIKEIKEYLDGYLETVRKKGIDSLKEEFGAGKTETLTACLNQWYSRQSSKARTYLSNNRVTNFMGYLEELDTYDENEILGRISKVILDMYLEDWKDDSYQQFIEGIHRTREEIELMSADKQETAGRNHIQFTGSRGEKIEKYYDVAEDDGISYFFKNAIDDALDEFGDSLEMNQKVSVLIQALEGLMKK